MSEVRFFYVSPASNPANRIVRTERTLLGSDDIVCEAVAELPDGWEMSRSDRDGIVDAWDDSGIAVRFTSVPYNDKDMPKSIVAVPCDTECPIGPRALKIMSREYVGD